MDLHAAMGRFIGANGEIEVPNELTLAALSEILYQTSAPTEADRVVLRYWDYTQDKKGKEVTFTRAQINTRTKVVATRLQQVGNIGDRVALLANNSPEYLFGFMGALYAGMVPVPLYDPTEPGHAGHLNAVFADAKPTIVITNSHSARAVRSFFAELPGAQRPRVISVDSLPDTIASGYVNPLTTEAGQKLLAESTIAPADATAFLQYTSGSTRTPAGVVLTHRSIITNILQIFMSVKLSPPMRLVSWLPLHHDMGIILAVFVTILGQDLDIMSPRDFIQRPSRWLEQLSARESDVNVYSVVPNFAFELAARYGQAPEGVEYDFSKVSGMIGGSEPVTEKAVMAFIEAFREDGLHEGLFRPSYGLAEASLLVTTPQKEQFLSFKHLDREELAQNKAVEVPAGSANAVSITSVGSVVNSQYMVIVDPETRTEVPDGTIGEIWCHGGNMAAGYLDRPEETAATFRNRLNGRLEGEASRAAGAPDDDRWMATGDLGVMIDDELYITGRLKDLVIIAGRNHYPQDIEYTVDHASSHVRPAAVAAFAVDADVANVVPEAAEAQGGAVEQLIIFAERDLDADPSGDAEAIEAIRAAVSEAHGVVPAVIRILDPDAIARSSAGKIARRVNKANYLAEVAAK